MSQSDSSQLILIDLHAPKRRALLLIPVILALLGAWFALRWYTGNTLAEYGPGVEEGGIEVARSAVRLAPRDPLPRWKLARLEEKSFASNQLDAAVRHHAEAVSLSPNDYRLWMDFGRGLELSGDGAHAEMAFRRAVELAPAYSYPRWYLGNLLLRAGRTDEAFTELRAAAESASQLRPQVFSLALQVFGQDSEAIKNAIGPSSDLRASLTSYLVSNQRLDEAFGLWNSFGLEEKRNQHVVGEELLKALAAAKRFRTALEIARELAPGDKPKPVMNQIYNGGFEMAYGASGAGVFGWQITTVPQAQASIDPSQQNGGARSLRLSFKSPANLTLNTVAQLVVVDSEAQYRFECYVRTDDLRSGGTPTFEIVDESDGTVLGATAPLTPGTNNWLQLSIDFETRAKTEAIRIRINRASCGQDPVCPIFGNVWYDDFNLQRAGRIAGPKPTGDAKTHRPTTMG